MSQDTADNEQLLQKERQRLSRQHLKNTVDLLAAMRERFGDQVLEVAQQHAAANARRTWAGIAARNGSNSIADLVRLLWEPMTSQGLVYTSEERDGGLQMTCTKCYLHDLAVELGQPEIVYSLTCSTDPALVEGFNPKIGFRRSKTLVEGHGCCNHFYFLKDEAESE